MEDKYYTPTIEEFHVGFEYEVCVIKDALGKNMISSYGVWEKRILTDTDFCWSIIQKSYNTTIRVKHLNKEDFESLGWLFINDSNHSCDFKAKKPFDYVGTDYEETWHIRIYKKDGTLYIHNNQSYDDNKTIFHGVIKNKSELKILLKQLNIS